MSKLTQQVRVMNALGFHVRAVSKLIESAARFQSHIDIISKKKQANAKRIFDVMSLGCVLHEQITVEVEGPDAQQALKDVTSLIEGGFGEGVVEFDGQA